MKNTLPLALVVVFVVCESANADGEPQPKTPSRESIEKLIGDLNSQQFRVREKAMQALIQIGEAVEPALREVFKKPPSLEVKERIRRILRKVVTRFEANAPGWNWVYQGIAHGQVFRAEGKSIKSLQLRLARLNDNIPEADLEIEVRDLDLRRVYARGFVSRMKAGRNFDWYKIDMKQTTPLSAGSSHVLLFHSQDTSNTNPWLVNQIYEDIYPHGGDVVQMTFDYFMRMAFKNKKSIHIGPDMDTAKVVPISSGFKGGAAVRGPLTLYGNKKRLVPDVKSVN